MSDIQAALGKQEGGAVEAHEVGLQLPSAPGAPSKRRKRKKHRRHSSPKAEAGTAASTTAATVALAPAELVVNSAPSPPAATSSSTAASPAVVATPPVPDITAEPGTTTAAAAAVPATGVAPGAVVGVAAAATAPTPRAPLGLPIVNRPALDWLVARWHAVFCRGGATEPVLVHTEAPRQVLSLH